MSVQPLHLERKTVVSSAWMLLAGCGLSVANGIQGTPLFPALPGYEQTLILGLLPAVATGLSGYITKHTHRADLTPAVPDAGPDDIVTEPDPFL